MANVRKVITGFRNANEEAAARYNERAESAASSTRLLRPDEVAGDYDANRLLSTTLGGVARPITREDLVIFKKKAEELGRAYRGGILPKHVIDRALRIDRDRSQAQIRVAIPTQYSGGKMHFITNAGPDSDVVRHHVLVEFMNYGAAVSSPSKASEIAPHVAAGPIRFSCDCGRHQFWYSYVATIGKFNAGVPQLGYPRVRNPNLVGVACKHVLRVMVALSQPLVRTHVTKMIEQGRRADAGRVTQVSAKDAKALAAHQKKTAHHKRSQIETSAERKARLAQQRSVRETAEKAKAKAKGTLATPAKVSQAIRKAEQNLRKLHQMGGISQAMLSDMLATLHGKK